MFPRILGVLCLVAACGDKQSGTRQGPAAPGETCSFEGVSPGFALNDGDELAGDALAIAAQRLPAGLKPVLVDRHVSEGAEHLSFEYRAGDVPLCAADLHMHWVDGRWLVEDGLSRASLDAHAWNASVAAPDASEAVIARTEREMGLKMTSVLSRRACLLVQEGAPVVAVDMVLHLEGRPYRVVGTATKLASVEPRWFGAVGEARVFSTGPRDGTLVSVPLTDLKEGVRLASSRFSTALAPSFDLAESLDRSYVYEPNDVRFVEVSAFANAERMASWFNQPEHGFSMRCVPIVIRPHHVFTKTYSGGTTVNNGEYVPPEATGTGFPEIRLGDGDGVELTNLGVDFDAVAHELGHHVLYRKLKSHSGESGVLHEGIADYFVFAATGNPCLGESICPAASPMCWVPGQCLRTGANDLRLDSADLPGDDHRRSQLISGYLWGLGVAHGHEWAARTTMKAVDYLGRASGYRDFVKALMAADLELAGGANACAIYDGALARGLEGVLGGVTCDAYLRR